MSHGTDFINSYRRHLEDAELLYDSERWANADQLYGFSAECGLKAVMLSLGMDVDSTGVPDRQYKEHVNKLWPIFENFVKGHNGNRYLRQLPCNEPFANWSHHDRYAHGCHFDRVTVDPHRNAAQEIDQMVGSIAQDDNS